MDTLKNLLPLLIIIILMYASCNKKDDDESFLEPTVEFLNDFFESKTCPATSTVIIQPIEVNWNGSQGTITLTDSLNDTNLQVNQQNGAVSYTSDLYFGDHNITLKIESSDGSFVKTESFLLQKEISSTLIGKEGTADDIENNNGQDISIEFTKQGNARIAKKYINGDLSQTGTFSYNSNDVIIELEKDANRVRIVGNAVCGDTPYFDAKTFMYPVASQSTEPSSTPDVDGYIRLYPQNN